MISTESREGDGQELEFPSRPVSPRSISNIDFSVLFFHPFLLENTKD